MYDVLIFIKPVPHDFERSNEIIQDDIHVLENFRYERNFSNQAENIREYFNESRMDKL